MGSFGDYLENKVLDHLFNKSAYTAPTIYIGLSTIAINDEGSIMAEPTIGTYGYARIQTAAADWHTSSGGVITNHNVLTFPKCVTGSWGTVSHYFAKDAASGGNFLFHGALANSNTINPEDTMSFAADSISISINGGSNSFCNFWEDEIMDHIFNKGSYTAPTISIGLSRADPTEDGSGTVEPVAAGYARVATAAGDWTSSSGGALSNANVLTFPQASGLGWGHITHVFGIDGSSNFLFYAELTVHKDVDYGDYFRFAVGDLDITLS